MHRLLLSAAPLAVVVGILAGDALGPGSATRTLVTSVAGVGAVALVRGPTARSALALVVLAGLACALERRALHGLTSGATVAAARARADVVVTATITDDPDGSRWSTRALARIDTLETGGARARSPAHERRTILIAADGAATGRVAVLAAGDHAVLRGWLHPLEGYDERLRWRHAVARLDALELVDASRPRSVVARIANDARAVALAGTDVLPATERALMAGFLLGDTRDLPEPVVASFRASGLSHLLAVSGANVAFVLALVGPALRRSPRGVRLVMTLVVLGLFGAMTRWEPSVLRACAMAATAVLASHLGRPARGVRVLALAVTTLLLVDPFLLRSVGFLLSCGASLGITLLAAPIARRLRGPAWFRESFGTTLAAQLGVAPVLIPVFGSVPLVALPANLLAVPLAGPLTTWGLTGGVVAGLVRSRAPAVSALLQVPTRLLADAVLGLADMAAGVPLALGPVDVAIVALAAGTIAAIVAARRVRGRMLHERALVVPPR